MGNKLTVELNKSDYVSLLQRIKFFQTIARNISSRKPLNELLDEIISSSKKLLNAEASSLLLFNKEENFLYFHTLAGNKSSSLKAQAIKIGEGIAGWVAEKKEALIIDDCYKDPRFNKSFDMSTGFKTRNMICAPMIDKDALVGVIQVINKKGSEPFNKEDLQMFEALAVQCAVAIENARLIDVEIKSEQIKNEMETAWKIQQRFLPERLPALNDLDMSIKLKPAKEIGGDYFNVVKIDDNNTLFCVADVSGKSVPAALIVSTLYSFFQFYFIIRKENVDPIEFVQSFNKFLVSSTTQDKFVTAWFGFYNHSEKSLLSISAGHNPTYVLKHNSDKFNKLTEGGLMLGSLEFPYSYEKIDLNIGDTVIFYTDGVTEAMNSSEEEFGEARLEELLLSNRNLSSNEISKIIFDNIKIFRGDTEQSDDITLGIFSLK